MMVLGADMHKRSHTIAAIAATTGELRGDKTVRVGDDGFLALLDWARALDSERVWALEGCRHVSGAFERLLIGSGERVVRVHRAGKVALSDFRAVTHYRDVATLMDVAIRTGRTHQIRVHSAFAGHPVAGDDKYGDRVFNAGMRAHGLRRMFLHASSIAFRWPDTGAAFRAETALPAELQAVLERLDGAAAQG